MFLLKFSIFKSRQITIVIAQCGVILVSTKSCWWGSGCWWVWATVNRRPKTWSSKMPRYFTTKPKHEHWKCHASWLVPLFQSLGFKLITKSDRKLLSRSFQRAWVKKTRPRPVRLNLIQPGRMEGKDWLQVLSHIKVNNNDVESLKKDTEFGTFHHMFQWHLSSIDASDPCPRWCQNIKFQAATMEAHLLPLLPFSREASHSRCLFVLMFCPSKCRVHHHVVESLLTTFNNYYFLFIIYYIYLKTIMQHYYVL